MIRKKIQMKMAFLQSTNISETKRGAKKKCMVRYGANVPKITCAEFGPKMFIRVRVKAANIMYYAIGESASFLRRECYRTP